MSKKMIIALVLIGCLVALLLLNTGEAVLNLGFIHSSMPKPVLWGSVFVSGIVTGALLSGK